MIQHRFQKTHFHDAINGFVLLLSAQAAQFGGEIQEAMDGHVRVGRRVFGKITEEALGLDRLIDHVELADPDGAGRGRDEPGNHPHGSGFACAVRAEEAEHLPALDRERNTVDGNLQAE